MVVVHSRPVVVGEAAVVGGVCMLWSTVSVMADHRAGQVADA